MSDSKAITVVDYGSGNTGSLTKALDHLGARWSLADSAQKLEHGGPVIFPGVGAFGAVMQRLRERDLVSAVNAAIADGRPFLGICIGLQVLFEESDESPGVAGLAALPGKCLRFNAGKVPQIGWNEVQSRDPDLLPNGHYYFVNSYYVRPSDDDASLAHADYHGRFTAAVRRGNVVATQFHPEKSGSLGLDFLRTWLDVG
ncbi:MAG: imidazole glycerol phosphate synthase subunit HisH [Candidatus Alcyoniella australis]|nr:imidazole glycerol phosphate synthase subunit HisH [Candidatus Alcyoniella australis]